MGAYPLLCSWLQRWALSSLYITWVGGIEPLCWYCKAPCCTTDTLRPPEVLVAFPGSSSPSLLLLYLKRLLIRQSGLSYHTPRFMYLLNLVSYRYRIPPEPCIVVRPGVLLDVLRSFITGLVFALRDFARRKPLV